MMMMGRSVRVFAEFFFVSSEGKLISGWFARWRCTLRVADGNNDTIRVSSDVNFLAAANMKDSHTTVGEDVSIGSRGVCVNRGSVVRDG